MNFRKKLSVAMVVSFLLGTCVSASEFKKSDNDCFSNENIFDFSYPENCSFELSNDIKDSLFFQLNEKNNEDNNVEKKDEKSSQKELSLKLNLNEAKSSSLAQSSKKMTKIIMLKKKMKQFQKDSSYYPNSEDQIGEESEKSNKKRKNKKKNAIKKNVIKQDDIKQDDASSSDYDSSINILNIRNNFIGKKRKRSKLNFPTLDILFTERHGAFNSELINNVGPYFDPEFNTFTNIPIVLQKQKGFIETFFELRFSDKDLSKQFNKELPNSYYISVDVKSLPFNSISVDYNFNNICLPINTENGLYLEKNNVNNKKNLAHFEKIEFINGWLSDKSFSSLKIQNNPRVYSLELAINLINFVSLLHSAVKFSIDCGNTFDIILKNYTLKFQFLRNGNEKYFSAKANADDESHDYLINFNTDLEKIEIFRCFLTLLSHQNIINFILSK